MRRRSLLLLVVDDIFTASAASFLPKQKDEPSHLVVVMPPHFLFLDAKSDTYLYHIAADAQEYFSVLIWIDGIGTSQKITAGGRDKTGTAPKINDGKPGQFWDKDE